MDEFSCCHPASIFVGACDVLGTRRWEKFGLSRTDVTLDKSADLIHELVQNTMEQRRVYSALRRTRGHERVARHALTGSAPAASAFESKVSERRSWVAEKPGGGGRYLRKKEISRPYAIYGGSSVHV